MTPELRAAQDLLSARAVRERCARFLDLARQDRLEHFRLRPERLDTVVDRVVDVTHEAHPDLRIPLHSRWRHFSAGGSDRCRLLDERLAHADAAERARAKIDLAVTSVLLDAGAGARWRYEESPGKIFSRSEGLAVASFHLFLAGGFSSDAARPCRADGAGLQRFTAERLRAAFQVDDGENPLVGVQGRVALMRRLGATLGEKPELFGAGEPRIGNLLDAVHERARGGRVGAGELLELLLRALSPIWPGRVALAGVNLGDTWRHPAAGGEGPGAGLVPFHKLAQWLAYSLVEPLEEAGLRVEDLDELTALAEYRNGGLLVDGGALEPRHESALGRAHPPGSGVVVEWRALTVALLDEIAPMIRARLGLTREELPLGKILEGGTWKAGRNLALERRPDGSPPLLLESDGTVF